MGATKTKRQPVDQPLRSGFLTHRDAIWASIRELKTGISTGVLESRTRASQATIKTYLKGLTAAGYLQRTDARAQGGAFNRYQKATWNLIKDNGVEAPRVTRDGEPVTQGLARVNMWRTMRIIGSFNLQHLVIQASTEHTQIKQQDAKDYIKYLRAAGYVRISHPGKKGRPTVYQFIAARYTGPKPPMVQHVKQVFDPNTMQVVWSKGATQ